MSQDEFIAQYGIGQCLIHCIGFEMGVITFGQFTFELHVEAEQGARGLVPLVLAYESLLGFTLAGTDVIRIKAPSDIIASWAEVNGLVMEEPLDASQTQVLLTIGEEDLAELKTQVAPIISANRRARSSSRWSATELLQLKPFTVNLTSQSHGGTAASYAPLPAEGPLSLHSQADRTAHDVVAVAGGPSAPIDATSTPTQHTAQVAIEDCIDGDHLHTPLMATTSKPRHTQQQVLSVPAKELNNQEAPVDGALQQHKSNDLNGTPDDEEAVVRLPRRAIRRNFTPSSQSLPSSIAVSPSAAPRKKNKRGATVAARHSGAASSAGIASASRALEAARGSDSEEDVPLGKLIFSGLHSATPAATRASNGNASDMLVTSDKKCSAARREEIKYDFSDLSSPHHVKEVRTSDVARTMPSKKRRASEKSSAAAKVTVEASAPPSAPQPPSNGKKQKAVAEAKSCGDTANQHSGQRRSVKPKPTESVKALDDCRAVEADDCGRVADVGDANTETPFYSCEASRVRMPTPSLVRPSMGRCSVRSRGTAVLDASDQDAAALKALLEHGVGEENLEDFLKSATRLGKRVREAKRQREESVLRATPADLADLARCATELLCLCAAERDTRRSKFFRVFGARVSRLQEKSIAVNRSLELLTADQHGLQQELYDLVEAVTHDQQRWDAVEEQDLRAAVASIKEKLRQQ